MGRMDKEGKELGSILIYGIWGEKWYMQLEVKWYGNHFEFQGWWADGCSAITKAQSVDAFKAEKGTFILVFKIFIYLLFKKINREDRIQFRSDGLDILFEKAQILFDFCCCNSKLNIGQHLGKCKEASLWIPLPLCLFVLSTSWNDCR